MQNHRMFKFPRERPRPWTPEEDQALLHLVQFTGRKDWTKIALHFPGRTGKHCRQRYSYHLEHEYKKGGWTPEEDHIIVELQAKLGNSWSKIAKSLPGRSDNAVKNRWYCALLRQQESARDDSGDGCELRTCSDHKVHQPVESTDPSGARCWTWEEDQILLNAVSSNVEPDWESIAKNLPGRTAEECQQRHTYHMDHEYKKGGWTPEEDQVIIAMQAKYGNSWTKIAKCLPGRSDNSVKNRWYCALLRRRPFREEASCHVAEQTSSRQEEASAADCASSCEEVSGKRSCSMLSSPHRPPAICIDAAETDRKRPRLSGPETLTAQTLTCTPDWQSADESFEDNDDIDLPSSPTSFARHSTLLRTLLCSQPPAVPHAAAEEGATGQPLTAQATNLSQWGSFSFNMSFSRSAKWILSDIALDTPPPPASPRQAVGRSYSDLRRAFTAGAQASCAELRWGDSFDMTPAAAACAATWATVGEDSAAGAAATGAESPSLLREIRRRNSWSRWSIEDECRRLALVAAAAAPALPERPPHAHAQAAAAQPQAHVPTAAATATGRDTLQALSADDMPAVCPQLSLSSLFPDVATAAAFAAGCFPAPPPNKAAPPAVLDLAPLPAPPADCGFAGDFAAAAAAGAPSWERVFGLTNDQPVSRQPSGRRVSFGGCHGFV